MKRKIYIVLAVAMSFVFFVGCENKTLPQKSIVRESESIDENNSDTAITEKTEDSSSERVSNENNIEIKDENKDQGKKTEKEKETEKKAEEQASVPVENKKKAITDNKRDTPLENKQIAEDKGKMGKEVNATQKEEYTEKAVSVTMYGKYVGGGGYQIIYTKAGEEYATVTDPYSGGAAYINGAADTNVIGETSNGWYHVIGYSSYGPAFPERVEGYVPKNALITKEERDRRLAELEEKEKVNNQPTEMPSESPAENPVEKPSNTPVPTQEVIEQAQREQEKYAEEYNRRIREEAVITSGLDREVFNRINDYRAEMGLEPYEWCAEGEEIATIRAYEQAFNMVKNEAEMDHEYGTNGDFRGECLCGGSLDPVNAWKNSPGHNSCLLGTWGFTKCVVATGYMNGSSTVVFVALFW